MRKLQMTLSLMVLLSSIAQVVVAQILVVEPHEFTLPLNTGRFSVVEGKGGYVKFKYAGVQPIGNTPNFIVLTPSSGTTPAAIQLVRNPSVVAQLKPGNKYRLFVLFTSVDQSPAISVNAIVQLAVPAEPPPAIQSVVNAASLQPVLSPGASVSILGTNLTGPTLSTTFDDTALYPTSVAATSVTFNGNAAPLLYLSPNQINAIVPFSLAGQTSIQVAVQRFDRVSATVTAPLQDTAPAIFTSAQNGTGQGAIPQQGRDGAFSYNSSSNPAPGGTALEIFATGQGVWTPPPQSDVYLSGQNFRTQLVSVTIGGQAAKILYAGTLGGYSNWSMLQVNAIVPPGLSPGPQPVVLKIGERDNADQGVVIWVQ